MMSPGPSRPLSQALARWTLALLVLAAAFLLARPVAATVDCSQADRSGCGPILDGTKSVCFTPATPTPANLWGELQPADVGSLPLDRDATSFNEFTQAYWSKNWFFGLEIRNGWLIAGLAHGIGVWDVHTSPASPAFVAAQRYSPAGTGVFPYIPGGEASKLVFLDLSAPDDTVAALAGANGGGLLVFDLTDKTKPRGAYQNYGKSAQSVYTAKINNTRYAFLSTTAGLSVYNLDQALAQSACLDDSGASPNGSCAGVFLGQLSTPSPPSSLHGDGNYLAVSYGPSGGFQIYDVSSPLSPQLKLTGMRGATSRSTQGIALWHEGSKYYLAARLGLTLTLRQPQTEIFDVSCIATGGCSALGAPLGSPLNIDTQGAADFLTFSRSGSTPFLYVSGGNSCLGADGQQHEWLYDVSDPVHPRDITPTATMHKSGIYLGVSTDKVVNYWSYYDRGSPTGFNLVAPVAGKFNGNYFYRAARALLDVHQWVHDVAPTANFTWSPTEIYPGTPVTFTDASTGQPTSWTWTFQDGSPSSASGAAAASVPVTFSSFGTKTVTLISHNATGDSVAKSLPVVVLSPVPNVTGAVTVSPQSPSVCQPVTFTVAGQVTGQPPLSYSWTLQDGNGAPVPGVSSSSPTLTWNTSAAAGGNYTASVTVSNGSGSAPKSASVSLAPLQPLAFLGANGAPENDSFVAGTVQFHAKAQGASSWSWDFGDGQGFRPATTDPVAGPNPTFTYTVPNKDYTVKVQVHNCVQNVDIPSAPLTVHIAQVTPLSASFQAGNGVFCGLGLCVAATGQAITFIDSSTGADLWDYDWSHSSSSAQTCSFTDLGHTTPVLTHTYTASGSFYPCLRVRRGASEQSVYVHLQISVSSGSGGGGGGGGGGGASISVSGTTSGQISQGYSYTASASGCSPASAGWSWSTGGGTISGSSSGSSVTITWSAAGTKTVSASNAACGSAAGTRTVTITDPNGGGGGGGGTLQAKLTFSPASPKPGDTVTFNGTSSTGSPTSYTWNFGDGSPLVTGATATHAFASAGTYAVQLSVAAPATGCPFAPCAASSSTTQTVVVAGAPPLVADYTVGGATCAVIGGFEQCTVQAGSGVTLTASTTDGATYQWSFGDGGSASGATTTHTWAQAGSFLTILTVTKGSAVAAKTKIFAITGTPPPPVVKSAVLPWIAQTRGALVQSSDLYVHNPSANPMSVTLSFRKRGLPDTNPPQVSKTIAPGATLYVADVLGGLFNRENIAGFISLTVDQGDVEPVITSYNTTFQADGKQFGQTISGISMSSLSAAAKAGSTGPTKNLVGLINNSDRLAYFGISNPSDTAVTYHLRLYDKLGKLIGETSPDLTVAPFGQRQFQSAEIESTFGVTNQDDYRVEVQPTAGGGDMLVPYASNLRLSSQDPSFIEAGSSSNAKAYLLGALSAPGANGTLWQSDLLLSNVNTQPVSADVTFTGIGVNAVPTTPVHVTLQPGETQRLQNVIAGQWNINNAIGLLTVKSSSPNGIFPIAQAESYDNSNPAKRFGQSMAALTDANAAGAGHGQYLAGLRQDATHRTTVWLFNPGTGNGVYDLVYRNLDGTVITTTSNVQLAGGKLRQFTPAQLPLPAGGVQSGFTLQIVVKSGQVLSAAQVVDNGTNDPSYIQGDVR